MPSAQSIIWSKGKLALYIAVVFHHIGRPRKIKIAQKERKTKYLVRIESADSGGGSFLIGRAEVALSGACSAVDKSSFFIAGSLDDP